ncbi:Mobile element protein [Richelia intracellularis]|nr:Mobile element protein [Richelia intracellularis]
MKEYFEKHPATIIAEASDAIEKITGIKRSPTQVIEFLFRTGLRCLKVGYVPGKSVIQKRLKRYKTLTRKARAIIGRSY